MYQQHINKKFQPVKTTIEERPRVVRDCATAALCRCFTAMPIPMYEDLAENKEEGEVAFRRSTEARREFQEGIERFLKLERDRQEAGKVERLTALRTIGERAEKSLSMARLELTRCERNMAETERNAMAFITESGILTMGENAITGTNNSGHPS